MCQRMNVPVTLKQENRVTRVKTILHKYVPPGTVMHATNDNDVIYLTVFAPPSFNLMGELLGTVQILPLNKSSAARLREICLNLRTKHSTTTLL